MSSVLPPRRPIVLKASRDTLVLLAAAGAMTLAIAYSVHNRPVAEGPSTAQARRASGPGSSPSSPPTQAAAPAPTEPLSSDALTAAQGGDGPARRPPKAALLEPSLGPAMRVPARDPPRQPPPPGLRWLRLAVATDRVASGAACARQASSTSSTR